VVVGTDLDLVMAVVIGAVIGGVAAFSGAYLALRHRAHSTERSRMATEIMYHVMTAVVLLEESLVTVEQVLLARDQGKSKKELRDMAEQLRKEMERAFGGYDPLRPHIDYRVGKLMRLPKGAMGMLDELERRLSDAFVIWDGGRLLQVAASGKDDRSIEEFDKLVTRSSEDAKRFAVVLRRV
jgi:hypothetical protein